jgi:hypothetical protein
MTVPQDISIARVLIALSRGALSATSTMVAMAVRFTSISMADLGLNLRFSSVAQARAVAAQFMPTHYG